MNNFGNKLKIERVRGNFTLQELAEKIGVTRQAISQWETNNRIPGDSMLRKIESALGLPDGFFDIDYQEMPEHYLPVLGYATAGLLETQYQEELGYIEVPEKYSDTKKYMCIKVSGDSMDKILPHGAYAVFNKTEHNYRNKPVLVEVNNETTIKHISESSSMVILTPNSNNPIHQPIYIDKNDIDELKIYGTLSWHCVDWEK